MDSLDPRTTASRPSAMVTTGQISEGLYNVDLRGMRIDGEKGRYVVRDTWRHREWHMGISRRI